MFACPEKLQGHRLWARGLHIQGTQLSPPPSPGHVPPGAPPQPPSPVTVTCAHPTSPASGRPWSDAVLSDRELPPAHLLGVSLHLAAPAPPSQAWLWGLFPWCGGGGGARQELQVLSGAGSAAQVPR